MLRVERHAADENTARLHRRPEIVESLAHEIDDDVDTPQSAERFPVVVVDRGVGSEIACEREVPLRRDRDHPGSGSRGKLHRERADTAGSAVHQDRLTRLDLRVFEQHLKCRQRTDGKGGRAHVVDTVRNERKHRADR